MSVGVCARVRGGALARGSSLQFGRCQRALRKMRASLNWRGLRPAAQQARLECIEKWPSFRVRMQIEPGTERRSGEGRREKADAHRFVHCAGLPLAAPRTSTRLFCELPCACFACTGPLFSMADTWLVMPSMRLEPAANDAGAAARSLTCSDGCRVRRRQCLLAHDWYGGTVVEAGLRRVVWKLPSFCCRHAADRLPTASQQASACGRSSYPPCWVCFLARLPCSLFLCCQPSPAAHLRAISERTTKTTLHYSYHITCCAII